MLPILLDLGIIKIYTLGVFLVLAFFIGAYWLWRSIKLTSFKEEDIFDGLFLSLFGALLGARLFHVLLNFSDFKFNILKFILVNGYPGLSLIGGLFGGFGVFYLYCRSKKMDFLEISDYLTTPLLFSLAIGKIGSFISGTDVGSRTTFFLHTQYVGYQGMRHLTALYEAVLFGLATAITYRLLFKIRRSKARHGATFFFFIIYFSAVEIILDFIKANHLYFAGLSFNMLILSLIFISMTGYFISTWITKYGKK